MQILIASLLLFAFFGSELTRGELSNYWLNSAIFCLPIFCGLTLVLFHLLATFTVRGKKRFQDPFLGNDFFDRNLFAKLQLVVWTGFSLVVTVGLQWSGVSGQFFGNWNLPYLAMVSVPHLGCLAALWLATEWAFPESGRPWSFSGLKRSISLVGIQFHHFVLPTMLPLLTVVGIKEGLELLPGWSTFSPFIQLATFGGTSVLLLTLLLPALIAKFWTSTPISETDHHGYLVKLAKTHQLNLSSVEVWNTGFRFANAVVIGTVPFFRKVLITDAMFRLMTKGELRAIFLHEAGHIRKNHFLWKLIAFALPLLLGIAIAQTLKVDQKWILSWTVALDPTTVLSAAAMVLFALAIFSVLSHHLELEADRFAVEELAETDFFHRKLDRTSAEELSNETKQIKKRLAVEDFCNALRKTIDASDGSLTQATLAHPSVMNRIVKTKHYILGKENGINPDVRFLRYFKIVLATSLVLSIVLISITL